MDYANDAVEISDDQGRRDRWSWMMSLPPAQSFFISQKIEKVEKT